MKVSRARAMSTGDRDAAIARYREAAMKATNTVEKNYLMVRAARLAEMPG